MKPSVAEVACECNAMCLRKLLASSRPGYSDLLDLNGSLHDDIVRAEKTLKTERIEANDNVLIIIAHDWSLLRVLDLHPHDINQ